MHVYTVLPVLSTEVATVLWYFIHALHQHLCGRVSSLLLVLSLSLSTGEERFRTLSGNFFHGAQAVLVVFSLVDEDSLVQVKDWVQQVETYHSGSELPIMILVGNKTDLVSSSNETVQRKDAETARNLHSFDDYLECSAAEGTGVKDIFHKICALLYKRFQPTKTNVVKTEPSRCCSGSKSRPTSPQHKLSIRS